MSYWKSALLPSRQHSIEEVLECAFAWNVRKDQAVFPDCLQLYI